MPSIKSAYEAVGNEVVPSESPEAFAAFVKSENRKWADIVKLTGVTGG
jgi:tripartite-type tricarboxylate transporter receptor subunit TctC